MKKIKLKGIFCVMLVLAMVLTGCRGSNESDTSGSADADKLQIGIIQYSENPSLDDCNEGILQGLNESSYKEKIDIDVQNGKGDADVCDSIAADMVAKGYDMIFAISTPAAQSAYAVAKNTDIPVIFCAVSDPVAAGLAQSLNAGLENCAGTSDDIGFDKQVELIQALQPGVKRIGVLYTTTEANSVSQLADFKEACLTRGIEVVEQGISGTENISQAAEKLASQSDCINCLTDNNVADNLTVLLEKADAAKIPVYGSEINQVKSGCIAAVSIDYVSLGVKTAEIGVKVLDGAKCSEIAVGKITESTPVVNTEVMDRFGITLPEEYSNAEKVVTNASSPVKGKKIAYILNMASSEIFQLCSDQCVATAEKLGMICDVFFSDGDDTVFKDYITTCAADGYDGLFLSHGGQEYSYTFLDNLLKDYPDLKIVTFDTQFKDASGQTQKIEGVTQFFQDDAGFATSLLDYICEELYPEKETVNVLKVWVGPNYIAAFDRREVGYQAYEESGRINTLEVIGPTDYSNATTSMYDVMSTTLKKYKEGDIDAIWVAYDAYAQGCYKALKESGKNIPLVSVDICNVDIQYMLNEDSQWKACACTDFKANGEQGVRILALELNGDYEAITDPKTGEVTDYIEMPASLITQDMLKSNTTIENIYEVAPEQYGAVENYVTNNWLKECIGY